MVEYVDIAIGVLKKNEKVCLSQRQKHQSFADKWEFPGGKVEADETLTSALQREFREELGIETHSWQPLIEIPWQYEKVAVRLHVFSSESFEGTPQGIEGQRVKWFDLQALRELDFPEANKGILTALQLADRYMMSGSYQSHADALAKLTNALEFGIELCQLKPRNMVPEEFDGLAHEAISLCHQHGAQILLNGDVTLFEKHPDADGLQLASDRIYQYDSRPIPKQKLLAVSTHSDEDIQQALKIGADFILLSPVKETASHPGVIGLGWDSFAEKVKQIPVPVYALGGMKPEDVDCAKSFGGQGVAAISGFWPG